MAIATYERVLISDDSPFDRGEMTEQQLRGRDVFFGKGDCNKCHDGPEFTKHQFNDIGVRPPEEDPGRGAITERERDEGRFKTPGLRNVALTSTTVAPRPWKRSSSSTTAAGTSPTGSSSSSI